MNIVPKSVDIINTNRRLECPISVEAVNMHRDGILQSGAMKITIFTTEAYNEFKELIQRGANLWPDASPMMKEFSDIITNGEVLQSYHPDPKS